MSVDEQAPFETVTVYVVFTVVFTIGLATVLELNPVGGLHK
jgi:hypothetical protein